jgi:hypothetical protein
MRHAPLPLPRRVPVWRTLAALAIVVLLVPPTTAATAAPKNLRGSYSASSGLVTLTWEAPASGSFVYHVWRDATHDGTTTDLKYVDDPPGDVPDPAYIYLVRAAPANKPEDQGDPAVVAVPTITCEVLSVTTTSSPPYLTVTLHGECLQGSRIFDKSITYDLGRDET